MKGLGSRVKKGFVCKMFKSCESCALMPGYLAPVLRGRIHKEESGF